MDRDGRWNRGRGHARVSGDCSHWLENQGETGRNVTGIRWAGREQGLTDVHQRFSIHNYAYHPVHNNFDSRVIIAFFGAKQVFPKNTLSWDDDFQPFFRIDWRESHLFLFVLLFFAPIFSISFNCEILSFFSPPRHDFTTLSLLSVVSTLDYIFLRFSLSLTIFSIPNPPFPSPLFQFPFFQQFPFFPSSSIEAFYPCKVRSKDSTHLLFSTTFIYLPSLLPLHFPFPTRSKKQEIVQNKSSILRIYRFPTPEKT